MQAEEAEVRLLAAGSISGKRRTVITSLPLDRIEPNPEQPRRHFDEERLRELSESIRDRGLIQPIVVRAQPNGTYLLIAGERRYRASRMAGLAAIPAIVRDDDPLEVALIENLQREDLTPLEEALGISALIREHAYTHADVASLLHKSRPHVTNTLALTKLPETIQKEYSAEPSVSRDILITIARQTDEEAMLAMWRRAKLERLSVKEFRREVTPKENVGPEVRHAINAARRLGRRLAALPGELPAEPRARLQRTLRRLRKRIETFL